MKSCFKGVDAPLPLLSKLFDAGTISGLLVPKLIARKCQDLCVQRSLHPQQPSHSLSLTCLHLI